MKYSPQTKKIFSISSLIVLSTILFCWQTTSIKAQDAGFEAGLAGQAANMNSNAIGTYMLADIILKNGRAKIKAGRATTTFTHSPDIYSYVASIILWDADEPQTQSERAKYLQDHVKRFEARMLRAGTFKLHDNADSTSFANLLSFEAYYDKKPTPSQLVKFRQFRESGRQSYLDYAAYQGSSEQLKEKLYIYDAMMSIQAIEWREKARAAQTNAERRDAEEKAKKYAEYRLVKEEDLR